MNNESVFSPDLHVGPRHLTHEDPLRVDDAATYDDTTMSTTDWNMFQGEHPELRDFGSRTRAQIQLDINALELAAKEMQVIDIDTADRLREEIRGLLFEMAEPYGAEITWRIDQLDSLAPEGAERAKILERIKDLEAEYMQILFYDPYEANMTNTTPTERAQIARGEIVPPEFVDQTPSV